MKLNSFFIAAIAALVFGACGEQSPKKETVEVADAQTEEIQEVKSELYEVDTTASIVRWTGSKPTEEHFGTISLKPSSIDIKDGQVVAGGVIVDMNSIVVEDIEDPKKNEKLLSHLKNEDFFNVEKHPIAIFAISGSSAEDTALTVSGDLIIKEIIQPTVVNYTLEKNGSDLKIMGTLTFDRTLYDIKYKSKSIFGDLGDKFIDDEIRLEFDLKLKPGIQ